MRLAQALLARAEALGVAVQAEGDRLRLRAASPPPPTFLAELADAKADLLRLLAEREMALPPAPVASLLTTQAQVRDRGLKYSGECEWYTPVEIIERARQVMGTIDVDPASNDTAQGYIRAKMYYTKERSGLAVPWVGNVWLNPPYEAKLIGKFVAKLLTELRDGRSELAIMLVHSRTDTAWFQTAASVAKRVCFKERRVQFHRPSGERGQAPPAGSAFLYFGDDEDVFDKVFGEMGLLFARI